MRQGDKSIACISRAEAGIKVLRYLERKFVLPRPLLFRLLRTGKIKVNQSKTHPAVILCEGDEVKVPLQFAAQSNNYVGSLCEYKQDISLGSDLDIVYMDDFFLVLNKASGLPVQPGSKHKDCVSSRLKNTFAGSSFIPAPAHRIDQHSSGLILAGRAYQAQRYLHTLFAEHKAELNRIYMVWVSGAWALPERTLFKDYLCLKRGDDGLERMYLSPSNNDGNNEATAEFRTLQILPDVIKKQRLASNVLVDSPQEKDKSSATLLAVRLLTGRKHQIRVQCASRGHPVIGDPRYGGVPYARLLLHACKITIPKADFLSPSQRNFVSRPDWLLPFNIQDDIWDSVNTYEYGC